MLHNVGDRRKSSDMSLQGESLSRWHFAHHKLDIELPVIELIPLR